MSAMITLVLLVQNSNSNFISPFSFPSKKCFSHIPNIPASVPVIIVVGFSVQPLYITSFLHSIVEIKESSLIS